MISLKNKLESYEKSAIINALVECDWVMAKAARQLGITERIIGYKIKKHGISIEEAKMKRKQRTLITPYI